MNQEHAARVWAAAHADPVVKAREIFGLWPWSKQREILWSVRNNQFTAVPSCHGPGKTKIGATAILDFVTQGPSRVITTAPTWGQVKDLLWSEINTMHRDSLVPIGGQMDTTRLKFDADWFAVGFSTDETENFQGHHAERLLLVVDEASGVPEKIFNAARGFLTASHGARVLLLGNPTRPAGTFFRACREGSPYNVIRISVFDTPNFTGERVPAKVLANMPTVQWQKNMLDEFGEDSPEYLVRVLGQFATTIGRQYFSPRQLGVVESACVDAIHQGVLVGDPTRGAHGTIRLVERGVDATLLVYETRHADHRYVIYADVAGAGIPVEEEEARPSGKKQDACCATVVSLDTGCVMAVFHDRCGEEEYAGQLARLGWMYNEAEIAVEATGGYGALTISTLLRRYRYRKLFRRKRIDSTTEREGHVYGWDTNTSTRPAMLANLRAIMRHHPEWIRSRDCVDECRTFVWNDRGTKAEAMSGCFDDRVMSAAGAYQLYELRTATRFEVRESKPRVPLSSRAPGVGDAPADRGRTVLRKRKLTVAQRAMQETRSQ